MYFGSMIAVDGAQETILTAELVKPVVVFQCKCKVWYMAAITTRMKLQLYKTIVLLTALYASKTLKITANIRWKLDAFHQ